MSRAVTLFAALSCCVIAPATAWAQVPIQPQSRSVATGAAPIVVAPAAVPIVVAPAAAPVAVPGGPAIAGSDAPAVINPADGPGECTTTTTTTTRCTGAAAPYASRPAPPAVLVVPPAPPVPSAAPLPIVLRPGWHLKIDPDGSWWRERQVRGKPALWVPGLTIWLATYIGGMFAGIGELEPETSFPVVGAFVAAGRSDNMNGQLWWAIDGIAQLGGFIMFVAGASMDGKLERLPVTIGPTSFYGGGNGVAVVGRF